jgi:hypothetical protein
MQRPRFIRRHRRLLTGVLLAALALRAIVPGGFMPASGSLFALEICRDQLATHPASHHAHDHGGTHSHSDRCPFGSAPAVGPASELAAVVPAALPAATPVVTFDAPRFAVRPDRAHRSRAPPALA